jgi:hypothetical protein
MTRQQKFCTNFLTKRTYPFSEGFSAFSLTYHQMKYNFFQSTTNIVAFKLQSYVRGVNFITLLSMQIYVVYVSKMFILFQVSIYYYGRRSVNSGWRTSSGRLTFDTPSIYTINTNKDQLSLRVICL